GGDQALVMEAAEQVFLITRAAIPEVLAEDIKPRLRAGLPATRRGVAIIAPIEPAETETQFDPIVLVRRGDAGVGGARVAVAGGEGQSGLALAGPSRGRGQRGDQQQAGQGKSGCKSGSGHRRGPPSAEAAW